MLYSSGPRRNATRPRVAAILSLGKTCCTGKGNSNSITSPAFHVRLIATYPDSSGLVETACPFTCMVVMPSPLMDAVYNVLMSRRGERTNTVNAFSSEGFTVSDTLPSHG